MRTIFTLIVLLTIISCDNNSSILSKLENQSSYLEKEFNLLAEKITNKKIANQDKWSESYEGFVETKIIVETLVETLKSKGKLTEEIYQNIDSFYIYSLKSDNQELHDIYNSEYDYWNSEYKKGQSLSKIEQELLAIKLKSIRNSLCKEYFDKVERLDFKFPCIMPTVKMESSELKVGQTFRAEIFIAAYDPFTNPICEINGNEIQMKDGKWYFEFPCEKIGVKTWKANIQMLGPDDYMFDTSVEGRFLIK